jgi:hypothetical protein
MTNLFTQEEIDRINEELCSTDTRHYSFKLKKSILDKMKHWKETPERKPFALTVNSWNTTAIISLSREVDGVLEVEYCPPDIQFIKLDYDVMLNGECPFCSGTLENTNGDGSKCKECGFLVELEPLEQFTDTFGKKNDSDTRCYN